MSKEMGKRHKPRKPLEILKKLMIYIFKNYKLELIVVVIALVISSLANVIGTTFIKALIDNHIVPLLGIGNPDFIPLLKTLGVMAVIYYVGVISTYIYSRLMVSVTQGTLNRIRVDLFVHMQSLPINFFDTHSHGNIMSLYTNDTDTLRQMINQSLPQLFSAFVTIIGIFVSMITLNIPLAILEVIMIGLILLVVKFVGGRSGKYFIHQQKDLGDVNGYIEEMMEGQKVVKVFSYEEESKIKFDKLNDKLCESANEAHKYANILMPILGNLGFVNYALLAIIGTTMAINGISGVTLGGIMVFLQLGRNLNQTVNQMSNQINSIVMALAGAERIFNFLDEKPEEDDGHVTLVNATINENGEMEEVNERTGIWAWKHPNEDGKVSYRRMLGDIVFEDVDFGYNPEKIVLANINLFAKPGEKIAFVGATGAGKTTITNLINRFYDIQKGEIRYDGININVIKKDDLRSSLGIVLQDTHLFSGTIADNIRYGKLDATDEEVIEAAKLANAHLFIKHLPEGYQTVISGDGSNLSQGQRQLLAIARAVIYNPPVLILDEATSSIDTRTEKLVQDGMDRLMEGRTVFVIAHRLSTIKNSDIIMVLEQGEIIERGSHDELIEKKEKYYQLYTGGFELT